jgi:ABC-2 type transport system permease protein
MRRALAVGRKEMHQIARDGRTLLILVFIPAFFLVLYGWALNFDIRDIALAVDDRDGSSESRELVSAFVNSGYFVYAGPVRSPADADRVMNTNEARAILVIPEGLARRVRAGDVAEVQVLINGDNANTATTVVGYASAILRTISAQYRAVPVEPPIVVEPRIWYNPELRSALYLVPGLIAFIMMLTATVSTTLSIVREKERGTMEQIRMAPIGVGEYVAGKTLPYLALSLAAAVLILLVSRALFGLPMRGSPVLLLVAMTLFLAGALGTGLLISTLADTQDIAFQAALLVAFLPTFILSGFIFPISSMPVAVQVVTYAVPARYFLIALRGVVLKGVELPVIVPQLVALTVYATAVLGLAALRLKRQGI